MIAATYAFHVHGWAVIPFLLVYFVPTIVAVVRRGRFLVPAVIVDVLLGWTIIGWVIAFGLAIPGPGARTSARTEIPSGV